MNGRSASVPTSLEKAVRILSAFTPWNEPMRLTDLSRASGLPLTTTYRVSTGLVDTGLVSFDPEEMTYSLGLRVLDLAVALLDASPIRRAALPYMAEMYRAGELNVVLAVPDGLQMVVLERLVSRASSMELPPIADREIGGRLGMFQASLGLAYAAWLERDDQEALVRGWLRAADDVEIRQSPWFRPRRKSYEQIMDELRRIRSTGLAQQEGEFRPNVRAISSPLFLRGNRPIAAVGLYSLDPRLSARDLAQQHGSSLLEVARRISQAIGHA